MRKTWTINNGWHRKNSYGQLVLCQIGPSDFDPDYDENMERQARYGGKLPYRSTGTSYVFTRKCDFDTAVEQLRKNGYIA